MAISNGFIKGGDAFWLERLKYRARVVGGAGRDILSAWRSSEVGLFRSTTRGEGASLSVVKSVEAMRLDGRYEVLEVRRETADAVTLMFASPKLDFEAGQFVTLRLEIGGEVVRRSYSICTDPSFAPRFGVTVKRVEGGLVSNFINDNSMLGGLIALEGPHGRFVLDGDATSLEGGAAPLVFVAGGAGITPIASMLARLSRLAPNREAMLLYGSRGFDDVIFRERLDALADATPGLTVRHVLEAPDDRVEGPSGRMTASVLEEVLPALPEARYFVCGPSAMMDNVVAHLRKGGVDVCSIAMERFASPSSGRGGGVVGAPRKVELTRSGVVVEVKSGQTLLDVSRASGGGDAIDFSCQVGGCGSCKVRVLEGEVEMESPNCLSESERAAGYRLACISRPRTDVVLDA